MCATIPAASYYNTGSTSLHIPGQFQRDVCCYFPVVFVHLTGEQPTFLEDMPVTTLQAVDGIALAPHNHDSLPVLPVTFYLPARYGQPADRLQAQLE